jgi:hypothetical protein
MPEAARHRRRPGVGYVLSGFPHAPVMPAPDWHALSARFV